jgi:tRNA pseudouridine55 synthase
MVSALKVDGQRLYALARRGQEIERRARRVRVYAIDIVGRDATSVDLRVRCGRGCYVRSIAHDLGTALGVPAHLESLRRLAVGSFLVEDALELGAGSEAKLSSPVPPLAVRGLADGLDFLPAIRVRRAFEDRVRNGGQPAPHFLADAPPSAGLCRLVTDDGRWLLALARAGAGPLRLELVFANPMPVHVEVSPA